MGIFLCIGLTLALSAFVDPALAQKRVALVIGNGAYAKVSKLPNPSRDAAAVEAMLKAAGFDSVQRTSDLGAVAMRRALRDFSDQARDADIAVVYYAGHGIEVNGANYLIPVDAVLERDIDVEDEAVSLERVNQVLEQAKRLRLVILDACRDNPFIRSMKRTVAGRSIGRGLAKVEVLTSDTLIAYAAKAGSTAADGDGANSPYTTALVKHLTTPGLDVRLALGRVRDEVLRNTGKKQEPFVYGSLGGSEISLVPAAAQPSAVAAPVSPGGPSTTSAAAREWQDVKDTPSVAVLQGYIQRHKDDPVYGALAQDRISALQRQQQAVLDKAEAERVAAEQRKIEADAKQKAIEDAAQRDPVAALTPGSGKAARDRLANGQQCPMCPEMVLVPAGSFTMGSPASEPERDSWLKGAESPQHKVSISRSFAIGRHSVTRGEFAAFVQDSGQKTEGGCYTWDGSAWKQLADKSWRSAGFEQNDRHPVVCVNWDDAKAYAAWLSRRTGKVYRLPSEAEREYAARAGTTTPFWWGSAITPAQANYDGSAEPYKSGGAKGEYRQRTVPVDSFEANPWGLYQVHGNVWEWTEDCWHDSYQGGPVDGSAWITACSDASRRVVRGGSWGSYPPDLRSAGRNWDSTDNRSYFLGFRLARTLNP